MAKVLDKNLQQNTIRLTMAQAVVRFLKNQYVTRDGAEPTPFFAGCFGIFGHGNVAGVGQALQENPDFRYYQCRNEQAMVHTAAAFAKMKNRLQTFVCTTSVGPGATNMITAAAGATINRLPVLLLPGDTFARRDVAPVLQQLEWETSQDVSVNDCFKPVSRYWDRINRPEQIITALPEAMRVLTSSVQTGAVTLALPQDVQAEAYDYPAVFFEKRIWTVARNHADMSQLQQAVEWIQSATQPLIVSGGGTLYSEATDVLKLLVEKTGIPVCETQAGKGSLNYDAPQNLGAIGATGTKGANIIARGADLVIGVGTRYSDFTTASKTAFQNSDVKFININVAEFDAYKHNALPLVGDAKVTLEALTRQLDGYQVEESYRTRCEEFNKKWDAEVSKIYDIDHAPTHPENLISQGEVIGLLNELTRPEDIVLCAAGSLPGDLHKLWRTRNPKGYHMEYGYSCMGYEIAGGLGVKMADPEREVYVMVGDGSYLMMAQEIVTAVQEGIKINIILLDNHGFGSIGALSESLGNEGFGTKYRYRSTEDQLNGEVLPIDFAANAKSLGADVITAKSRTDIEHALKAMKQSDKTTVLVIPVDREKRVGGYESWWDVPVAEVSTMKRVQDVYTQYQQNRQKEVVYYTPVQPLEQSLNQTPEEVFS